ncbi:hypothetical protein ACFXHA_11375 [Nocardia sp. NPDC059240]|uniref:TPR repeat region-containing protein n=1 Tax=Nocardia sp. NPDC059240 TaxID=3346786 RepID=UPI0036BA97EB
MATPTKSQVMSWKTGVLGQIALDAGKVRDAIDTQADTLNRTISALDWSGAAHDGALGRADSEKIQQRALATSYDNFALALEGAEGEIDYPISQIQSTLTSLPTGWSVAEDFTVTAPNQSKTNKPSDNDKNQAANDSVSLQGLARAIGESMDHWAPKILDAINSISGMAPTKAQLAATNPLDQLTPDQARKDLQSLKNGTADPSTVERLRLATHLSADDSTALDTDGTKSVNLPQFGYLQAFTQAMNGMSPADIDKLGSTLPGNEPSMVQAAIANDFRLISNPQIHAAGLDGQPSGTDTGGMKQLPDTVQTWLRPNPSGLNLNGKDALANGGDKNAAVSAALSDGTKQMGALADLMSKGDTTIQGSDINRALIKQGAEIAALDTDKNSDTGKLADKFLFDAAGDHTAARDAFTNPDNVMDVTCTPGGHYDADSHVLDIIQHQWNPDQLGAQKLVSWIGQDAGSPNQFLQQRAGESATALANVIVKNQATLSHDIPGYSGYVSFGELNPNLSIAVAKSLEPYIPNFVGVNAGIHESDLLVNHYAGNLATAGTHAGVDYTAGDLSNLFKVIDSNPQAATEFNEAAAHLAGQLDFKAGAGYDYAALQSAQLTGAMQAGLHDELKTLIDIDHLNANDAATAAYNKKLEIADIVTGIVNGAGSFGPEGGAISTAAWILDPIIKAQIETPDTYGINLTPTHWSNDLALAQGIGSSDPLYQDVNIIRGYNSLNPGTFERFNTYEFDGHTHKFFDDQGRPNVEVIKKHPDAFQQALTDIMEKPLGRYDLNHNQGWVKDDISVAEPEDGDSR